MIYVDSSVVLAAVAEEASRPEETFWQQPLFSSRLMLYECWNRVHARNLVPLLGTALVSLTQKIHIVELTEPILRHAMRPMPNAPKTLDAIHLSTALFLGEKMPALRLATYDKRMAQSAAALGLASISL